MPTIRRNENKDDWMERCVSVLIEEGKTSEQAVAICASMYENKQKGDTVMTEEQDFYVPRSGNSATIAGIKDSKEELDPEALPDELRAKYRKPMSDQNKESFPIDE